MRFWIILAALAATPALAQSDSAAPPSTAPITPNHLATAQATVDHVWPIGTYARMMDGTMDQMMDAMMASMFEMRMGDVVGDTAEGEPLDAATRNQTMRQVMLKSDPHFEERFRIMNRVMSNELVPVATRLEPYVREGLTRAYARRFSTAQLADLNRFFATPSGSAYAADSMMLFFSPEVIALMAKMGPELVKQMPAIMQKVTAATAHLPPPPKRDREDEDER